MNSMLSSKNTQFMEHSVTKSIQLMQMYTMQVLEVQNTPKSDNGLDNILFCF